MRAVILALVISAAACSERPSPPADPNAYEVDAKGAPAMVEHRWPLRAPPGDPIGVILSIARCGDVLYAAGPAPSREGQSVVLTTLDLALGNVRSRIRLPGEFMPTLGGAVVAEGVMVGGLASS